MSVTINVQWSDIGHWNIIAGVDIGGHLLRTIYTEMDLDILKRQGVKAVSIHVQWRDIVHLPTRGVGIL